MKETVPGLTLCVKEESRAMRAVAWVFRKTRVNARFLEDYVTVIGRTVYVPRAFFERPAELFGVLAHEWVHALRAGRGRRGVAGWASRAAWSLAYLAPQALAALSVPLAAAALLSGAWWLWLVVAASLAALAPWPSGARLREEVAAYAVTVALKREVDRAAARERIAGLLSGWPYYRAARGPEESRSALARAESEPAPETTYVLTRCAEIQAGEAGLGPDCATSGGPMNPSAAG